MIARNQSGQSLTEYACMLALVLAICLGCWKAISGKIGGRFSDAAKVISSVSE